MTSLLAGLHAAGNVYKIVEQQRCTVRAVIILTERIRAAMVKIKNTERKELRPPLAVVPYRCVVCKLSFNHRQSLSRHYKRQHKLPSSWEPFGAQTSARPPTASPTASSSMPASASLTDPSGMTVTATLTVSSAPPVTASLTEPSLMSMSAVPPLTHSAEQAAGSQPSTSAAAWADEAVAAVFRILSATPLGPVGAGTKAVLGDDGERRKYYL